ncbi:hypothetical protein [Chitinophaga sp.]|uniref:hypothetical protein n=1 Tax=Chitinophaga sp. TaxID=1869181 RepID=UPI0031E11CE5
MNIATSISTYFGDMGFYPDARFNGRKILQKKMNWTIAVYILVSLGIFCRQITNFPKVTMNMDNFKWNVFFASLIFGFAILPAVMKRISHRRRTPSLEHILTAFGIGFFIDFANSQLIKYFS